MAWYGICKHDAFLTDSVFFIVSLCLSWLTDVTKSKQRCRGRLELAGNLDADGHTNLRMPAFGVSRAAMLNTTVAEAARRASSVATSEYSNVALRLAANLMPLPGARI